MYDELIKALRCFEDYDGLDFLENRTYAQDIAREAADAIEEIETNYDAATDIMKHQTEYIEELEAKLPRWIPVTERLPDAGERVLCYCRANIYEVMKMRTDGDWVYDTNHIYMRSFVTHWMPLPEPPKEE